MIRALRLAAAFACLAVLLAMPAAATDDVDWSAGVAAFERGDYQAALEIFETARDAGLQGPAVHYNIAVCQFELGRFPEAEQTFALIATRFPNLRALAEYNRGLAQVELGDDLAARRHFETAHRLAGDDATLRALAATMLGRSEADASETGRLAGAWGINIGYDDNIVLRDDTGLPGGTTTESSMADAYVALHVPLGARSPLYLDGRAYLLTYPDADEFDQAAIDAELGYDWTGDRWLFGATAGAGHSTFGGDSFDHTVGARMHWSYKVSRANSIEFAIHYSDIREGDDVFAGIEGSRVNVVGQYRWQQGPQRIDIAAERERNDRADPGVSPSRTRVGIRYRYTTATRWSYRAAAEYRRSEFDDLAIRRAENRKTLTLGLARTIGASWELSLQVRLADNDSSDPQYSYQRRQVTLGVQSAF